MDTVIGVGALEPVAGRLAGRLDRPLAMVDDIGRLPGEIARMRARGPVDSVLVVAGVAVLDLEVLQALDAVCIPGTGWGLVTGLDDAAIAGAAGRIADPPTLMPDDVALLDLFARRLSVGACRGRFDAVGAAALFDRPPRGLVLAGHGDGTHATVGVARRQLCGVLGDIETDLDGEPVPGGCVRGQRCRRVRDGRHGIVALRDLAADLIVHATCNGVAAPGQSLPVTTSMALAAMAGGAAAYVAPAGFAEYVPGDAEVLHESVYSGASLAAVADVMRELAGPSSVVTILGDPAWRPVAAPPARTVVGRPAADAATVPAGRELSDLVTRLSSHVDDLAGYREVLRATVGHDLLPGASAWLDPLHAALTAAAGPAVLAVRRRGPVPDLAELEGLRDGLLASVRDATGTLTADLAGNVLPLGQYAFDPGPAYSVVERGSGPVCGGCGIGMQTLRYHAVAAWMPGRCVDVCPLCGPSVLRRTDDPPVLLAVRERAAPGGEIRLRLSAPSAGPDRTGQARLFLLSRDGAVLAEARDDLAVSTWDISLPAPPGPPDTYRVAGVVCLDLSVQLLRGRVAVW